MPAFLYVAAALALSSCSTTGPADPPLRVLFVGNSLTYTNNLPAVVEHLSHLPGARPIEAGVVAFPNFSLGDHLAQGDAAVQIQRGNWDVVVLQQGPSALPESREDLIASTRRFRELTRPGRARLALYGVWPASDRLTAFDSVTSSYAAAASAVGGVLLPAGRAWTLAWAKRPALGLYGPDGFHPGPLGSLLAALVIYQGLTGQTLTALPDAISIAGTPLSISPTDASILLQASQDALQGSTRRGD